MAKSDWTIEPFMFPIDFEQGIFANFGWDEELVPQVNNNLPGSTSLMLKTVTGGPPPNDNVGGTTFLRTLNPTQVGAEGVAMSMWFLLKKDELIPEVPSGELDCSIQFRIPLATNIQNNNDLFQYLMDLFSESLPDEEVAKYFLDSGFSILSDDGQVILFPSLFELDAAFETPPPNINEFFIFNIGDTEQDNELLVKYESFFIKTGEYTYQMGHRFTTLQGQLGPAIVLNIDIEQLAEDAQMPIGSLPSEFSDMLNPARKYGLLAFCNSSLESTITIDDIFLNEIFEAPDWSEGPLATGDLNPILLSFFQPPNQIQG